MNSTFYEFINIGVHFFQPTTALGHVPIIDTNPRRGEKKDLKDNYGGRFVGVRGAAKVMTHLMFGLIAVTATQLFRIL